MDQQMMDICKVFRIKGKYLSYEEINIGNVNKTYKVNFLKDDMTYASYVVQKLNTYVFRNPEHVMENILKKNIRKLLRKMKKKKRLI